MPVFQGTLKIYLKHLFFPKNAVAIYLSNDKIRRAG